MLVREVVGFDGVPLVWPQTQRAHVQTLGGAGERSPQSSSALIEPSQPTADRRRLGHGGHFVAAR